MFRDPCVHGLVCWEGGGEARVLLAPCVAGPLVCTACARACGNSAQQFYWVYGRWIPSELVSFGLELHSVIEAQCTYGRLHDMGRFEQLTCSPRQRLGGVGWAVLLPGVEIPRDDVAC